VPILDNDYDIALGPDPYPLPVRQEPTADPTDGLSGEFVCWVDDFNPLGGIELSTNDQPRVTGPGTLVGADVPLVRRVAFDLHVTWGDDADLQGFFSYLADATSAPGEHLLRFRLGGMVYTLFGRYRLAEVADLRSHAQRYMRVAIRFDATDPFLYQDEEGPYSLVVNGSTVTLDANGMPNISGGTYTTITPNGSGPARWRVAVSGAFANPVLRDNTNGRIMWLTDSARDLKTASGALAIDAGARTITYATPNDWLQFLHGYSSWIRVRGGTGTALALWSKIDGGAGVPGGSTTCGLYYRPADLGLF